jgi:hypothetical protein
MSVIPDPWQLYPMPPEQVTAIQQHIAAREQAAVARTMRAAFEAAKGDPEQPIRGLIYLADSLRVDLDGETP